MTDDANTRSGGDAGRARRGAGSRRTAREYALMALYDADASSRPAPDGMAALWDGLVDGDGLPGIRPPEGDEVSFAARLVDGVQAHREDVDALIEACSTNWRLARMPLVDRNVLRIAAFELMHCEDIPANVTCNEAVELAKRFGAKESRAFVNGLVDRMGRQLGRLPARGR